jgi:hypothetical protein
MADAASHGSSPAACSASSAPGPASIALNSGWNQV